MISCVIDLMVLRGGRGVLELISVSQSCLACGVWGLLRKLSLYIKVGNWPKLAKCPLEPASVATEVDEDTALLCRATNCNWATAGRNETYPLSAKAHGVTHKIVEPTVPRRCEDQQNSLSDVTRLIFINQFGGE